MGKSIGVMQFLGKKYQTLPFPPEWIQVLGTVERGFRMLIWGPSGSGKTTFALRMCKMLAQYGKVYYNSIEQGEGASLQNAIRQVGMQEVAGKIVFGDRDTYAEMIIKLKRNKAMFFVIDSAQYMKLTEEQYKELNELFHRKGILIISWEGAGGHPKGEAAKSIRYMVDVKVHVKNGVAVAQSRYGATVPYRIFDQPQAAGSQQKMELEETIHPNEDSEPTDAETIHPVDDVAESNNDDIPIEAAISTGTLNEEVTELIESTTNQ